MVSTAKVSRGTSAAEVHPHLALVRRHVCRDETLEERVLGALRALWSMAAPGEPKEIVARLAKEFEASMGRPRVTDKLLQYVGQAQANARSLDAVPRGDRDVSLLIRLKANLEGVLTEAAG